MMKSAQTSMTAELPKSYEWRTHSVHDNRAASRLVNPKPGIPREDEEGPQLNRQLRPGVAAENVQELGRV
jgi:hypothetical protein